MNIPSTPEELNSYKRGVEQDILGRDLYWEQGYQHVAREHLLTGSTLSTKPLSTPQGRLKVANALIEYFSGQLEEYLGFKLEGDAERKLAFKKVLGVSALDLKFHLANSYKVIASGKLREVLSQKKKNALALLQKRFLDGFGLTIDEMTGNLVSAKNSGFSGQSLSGLLDDELSFA